MSRAPDNLQALQQRFAWHLRCPDLQLQGPISVRDLSLIYRGQSAAAPAFAVAIKCCRSAGSGAPDPAAALAQFEALQRVSQALHDQAPRFGSPAALHLDADAGAYAMAWLPGTSLTDWLARQRGGNRQAITEHLHLAGRWLGHFHQAGPYRAGQADLDSKLAGLAQMRERPLAPASFRQALAQLGTTAATVRPWPVHLSWLHGDCKADNLMLVEQGAPPVTGVQGIDIALAFENSVEHDLAQFLNHLDLLAQQRRHRHLRAQRQALADALLAGYRSTGAVCSEPTLAWLRLWSALSAWHAEAGALHPLSARGWLLGRRHRLLVGLLAPQLAQALVRARAPDTDSGAAGASRASGA